MLVVLSEQPTTIPLFLSLLIFTYPFGKANHEVYNSIMVMMIILKSLMAIFSSRSGLNLANMWSLELTIEIILLPAGLHRVYCESLHLGMKIELRGLREGQVVVRFL